jgi:hypothetical protein
MKKEVIDKLEEFRKKVVKMKKDVLKLKSERVSKNAIRNGVDAIANIWVEELRSPLEHKFHLDPQTIAETAEDMKRLHILSRPNNLKSSYLEVISRVLKDFDNKFILPIKQTSTSIERVLDLNKIIPSLPSAEESEYLREAIECAGQGHQRAAIVMGWCCAIDRMQRKIMSVGLPKFNSASKMLKNQNSGKFKNWNKEFHILTLSELQQVFDKDLIIVLEGMGLLDGNQSERLIGTDFQYRCHSAHPGDAPIEESHVVAFFVDINEMILQNPKFAV